MKFLSVCPGIEAASVAFSPMGWKAVAFSEIEKFPSAVLDYHYPDVPNLGDMTKWESWPEMDLDLLCGGTPCQSFSVAGKRGGIADERGNLALEFCRIADRYKPEWVLWENVPGVLSSTDNAFGCFLAELAGANTPIQPVGGRWPGAGVVVGKKRSITWRILDAQYIRVDGYGNAVPQRRRRVFVVAHSGRTGDPATVLLEPEGSSWVSPPRRRKKQTASRNVEIGIPDVCGCLSDGAHHGGGLNGQDVYSGRIIPQTTFRKIKSTKYEESDVGSTLLERDYKDAGDLCIAIAGNTINRSVGCGGNGKGFDESGAGYTLTKGDRRAVCYENHPQDSRVKEIGNCAPCLKARCGTGGGNLPFVVHRTQYPCIGGDVAFSQTVPAVPAVGRC